MKTTQSTSAQPSRAQDIGEPTRGHIKLITLGFALVASLSSCKPESAEPEEGPEGNTMMMELPRVSAEERCEGARSKVRVLTFYGDRLDAYSQDERGFTVELYCKFLDFAQDEVTTATGIAEGPEGEFAVVYDAGELGGGVIFYDNNGELIRKVEPNINLSNPGGIWWVEEGYVVWNASTSGLFKLDAEGSFVGPYSPPMQSSTSLSALTDLQYLGRDEEMNPRLLATFSDRPPRLFAFPDSPSFDEGDIQSAWAMTLVSTQIGEKIAFSGEVEGASGGVIQYRPVISGRVAPEKEKVIIYATDMGYGNGADIVSMDDGFFILDTSEETGPSINSFNTFGIFQEPSSLEEQGAPMKLLRTRIFKDL